MTLLKVYCSHAITIQVSLVEPDLSFPLHNAESSVPKSRTLAIATIITAAEYYSCYISNNSTLSESELQQLTQGPVVGEYALIVRYVAVE